MAKYRFITDSSLSGYGMAWNECVFNTLDGFLYHIYYKLLKIYDADNCGEETLYVRFYTDEDPTNVYYALEYSWYIDYNPRWNLIDNIDYVKVNPEQIPEEVMKMLIGDRDWLIL